MYQKRGAINQTKRNARKKAKKNKIMMESIFFRNGVKNGWDSGVQIYLIKEPAIQTPGWYLFHWLTSRVDLDDAEQTS